MAPRTFKALVVPSKGENVVKDVDTPEVGPNDILIKTEAVALNPTDWKHRDFISEPGSILGCDFAGTVDDVGSGVTNVKKGDRVAGFVHGGRVINGNASGSFAEYIKTESTLVWKVPSNVDIEEAAALGGIGPHTAAQHLHALGLHLPDKPVKDSSEAVLIWSGATSVGMYAIQLAKLAGYTVIATASPKNFDLLKSLGADDLYSYSDSETPAKISAKYPKLSKAVDTISESAKGSIQGVLASLGKDVKDSDKHVRLLLPVKGVDVPEGAKVESALVYTVLGKPFSIGGNEFPANKDDKAFIEQWLTFVPEIIGSGKFKSNPISSQSGGLEKIPEGLQILKDGKNSATKITYKI